MFSFWLLRSAQVHLHFHNGKQFWLKFKSEVLALKPDYDKFIYKILNLEKSSKESALANSF